MLCYLAENGRDRLTRLEKEFARVEAEIAEKEAELAGVVPEYEDKVAQETASKQQLEAAETTLRTLYAKQGRVSQFKTQKERDAHLRLEVSNRSAVRTTREAAIKNATRDLAAAKQNLEDVVGRIQELRKGMDGRKAGLAALAEELAALQEKQAAAIEKRK